MNLAAEAIRINSLGQARQYLERQRARAGEPDHRHWEWSWLLSQLRDRSDSAVPAAGAAFNRLGIDPAGRTLAIPMGRGGKLQLFDLATRAPRGELDTPSYQAFFSPGSRWIASVVSQQGRVDVFDAATGATVARLPRELQVNDVAFSPDESLLAITSDAHTAGSQVKLQLWRWATQTLIAERGFPSFQESYHYKLAFHPDGQRLALTEREGEVRLLNTTNLAEVQVLEVYDRGAGPVAISPDGRWLAAGVDGRESSVYVWDLLTNRPPVILRLHPVGVASLAFSADSRRLAGGASDQTVKLWSLPAVQPDGVLRGHTSDLRTVGFLGNGDWLASASSGPEIKLWNLRQLRTDTNDWLLPPLKSPRLSSDFRRFSGIGPEGTLVAGDTYAEIPAPSIPGLGTGLRLAAQSADGTALATLDRDEVLRLRTGPDARILQQSRPSGARLARLGFIRNGEFLVTIDDAGLVRRWTRELQPAAEFMLPRGFTLTPGALMIEHERLVCAGIDGRKVLSLMDGAVLATLQTAPGTLMTSALSSDGRLLVTGNDRGEVEFHGTTDWRRQGGPLRCQSDGIWLIALSPDGRRLATSGFQRDPPRLWDIASRQQICTLPGFPAGVTFLRFSADGSSLAVSDPTGRVRILRADWPIPAAQP
jgi:WD40 repeat protein